MGDPTLGSAVSAAARLGSAVVASRYNPIGQPRVGGKEERRQVYTRFQEAVVAYVMQVRDSRLSPEAMGLEPAQRKPYLDALIAATTEMAQALYELRLVGNPEPIEAAENVRQAVSATYDVAAAERRSLTAAEVETYARAMHGFTSACRNDLWYQPRWWQLWRGQWWRERRQRLKARSLRETSEQTPPAPTPQVRPASHVAHEDSAAPDAVETFRGPINNVDGAVAIVSGSVIQARDLAGEVLFSSTRSDEGHHDGEAAPGRG